QDEALDRLRLSVWLTRIAGGSRYTGVMTQPANESTEVSRADILDEISRIIGVLESHSDLGVRENVAALLEGIDTVHRTALSHLFGVIQGMGGDAFINKLTADPAIRLLFMSYDLLAVDRRLTAEEALDAVRGHLHAHGVDVELLDVAGSEVFVRLHGIEASGLNVDAVSHDIEEALKPALIGFQALVIGDRQKTKPGELIQLGGRRVPQRPVYREAFQASDLDAGEIRAAELGEDSVLIANVGGEFYAVANRCGESPLPLTYSRLEGGILVCSWHGCRYDVRTGGRVDEPDFDRLRVYPVKVNDGEIQIAVGVEPAISGASNPHGSS
ncbi:MAG: Rieske 2Fe-2S domain-containing protein, partial [Gemmatimonadales bacterium]